MRAIDLILPLFALCLAACGPKDERVDRLGASDDRQRPAHECDADGDRCERHGIEGQCLANRCILSGGACSYDQDCADGNECSLCRCVKGQCTVDFLEDASCGDEGGRCKNGACLKPPPNECRREADCRSAAGPCVVPSCEDSSCITTAAEDGALCRLPSNMYGRCESGECIIGEISTETRQRCRTVRGLYGSHRECEDRLRYALTPDEIAGAERVIAKRIKDSVLYDVHVSLVALADGGYNIVLFNKHSRDDLRGLIDPSFIALEVATYTDSTNWKSRMLQVWIEVYQDGWQIPTSGGRRAVKKGQEASALGYFGVVEIKSFRTWLQRSFLRMEPAAPQRESVRMPSVPIPLEAF